MDILTIPESEEFLRTPTFPIHKNQILKSQDLIYEMRHIMYRSRGVGIAANQVGSNWSIFIVNKSVIKKPLDLIIINPEIIWESHKKKLVYEGCLSIPNRREKILRSESVSIKAWNEFGNPIKIEKATGLFAQVLQHEIGHLKGQLYIDLLERKDNNVSSDKY